jgi:Fic family protein
MDGNGRVGRLLIHLVMKKWGYDLKGLAPFEEFLEKYRSDYYDLIAVNRQDQTEYVEFMLEGIVWALREARNFLAEDEMETKLEDELPLRRGEMLRIIRDHQVVSFDFIRRRFMRVSPRTLRYDLMMLVKKGLIRKRGVTKGVKYEVVV